MDKHIENHYARSKFSQDLIHDLQEKRNPFIYSWNLSQDSFFNAATQREYKNANHLILQYYMNKNQYDDPRFMTYNQIMKAGYHLKDAKNKGIAIEYSGFYDTFNKKFISKSDAQKIKDIDEEDYKKRIEMGTVKYTVFNAAHIVGLPTYQKKEKSSIEKIDLYSILLKYLKEKNIHLIDDDILNYNAELNCINIPNEKSFSDKTEYLQKLCFGVMQAMQSENNKTQLTNSQQSLQTLVSLLATNVIFSIENMPLADSFNKDFEHHYQNWIHILESNPSNIFYAFHKANDLAHKTRSILLSNNLEQTQEKNLSLSDKIDMIMHSNGKKEILQFMNDDNYKVRLFVARNISPFFKKEIETLSHDKNEWVRAEIAKRGFFIEKFVHDPSHLVREEIARAGYKEYFDILKKDKDPVVRAAVVYWGRKEDLETLVYDRDFTVRGEVARLNQTKYLNILVNDDHPYVRDIIAKYGGSEFKKQLAEKETNYNVINQLLNSWNMRIVKIIVDRNIYPETTDLGKLMLKVNKRLDQFDLTTKEGRKAFTSFANNQLGIAQEKVEEREIPLLTKINKKLRGR